ncbi:MAG: D-alanyl-D-alanine carboxypeptidase [Kistimonas sp.]|nr:D-alanyl-D-alanine carboxypeptidase [Kistimonas sp.]
MNPLLRMIFPSLRKGKGALWALVVLLAPCTAGAATAGIIPSPPRIAAKSYILMDAASGDVLAEQNADEKVPPASLTKMMTAYVVESELAAGNIGRDEQVTVSERAWRMRGSLMFIEVGEQVSVDNLLKGVIIVSGNDASVALAEHVAGSERAFSDLMNATANKLGMASSHFQNASGWPAADHYTTARDLAILSRHIIQDYPEYYASYAEKEFQYGVNKRTGEPLAPQPNRNSLLWSGIGVDGLKTGHTSAAGYCLAASATQDDRRLIAVVMGAANERARARETQKLLTYGFRFFENVAIKSGGISLTSFRVWQGDRNTLSGGLEEDLVVTVPRGTSGQVEASVRVDSDIRAPVEAGQVIGSVVVRQDGEIVKQRDLLALETVKTGSFLKRMWDSILYFFSHLLG